MRRRHFVILSILANKEDCMSDDKKFIEENAVEEGFLQDGYQDLY